MPTDEKPCLLLVDDKQANLFAIERLLEDTDCQVVKAASGQDALRLVWKYDFALVLLDVQMPGMDGFEVAKLMRSNARTKQTPIIFVTANKEKAYLARFREVGATGYLFKPIEPDVLKSKVTTFLNLYRHKARIGGSEFRSESRSESRL